jgi:hemerythrin
MNLIEWRDSFSLGLPEVDFEHQQMIGDINRLHGDLGADAMAGAVASSLGEILSAITAHFALEEKSMVGMGYPGYPIHKSDHERLIDCLLDILDEVNAEGRYDAATLSTAMTDWFVEHFRTHDAELHRWMLAHGHSASNKAAS